MHKAKYIIFLILLAYQADRILNAQVQITINAAQQKHTISPLIQGMGIIYSFETDAMYEDGRLAQIYKDAGAGFLRWPGGAVTTYYHWNNLNGQGWMDNWNPNYNPSNDADPSEYMDLDEYMVLCRAAETEPMLGINMSSGMEWDREADALNEAVGLVKYCIAQNFDVNYIYLDNETYHTGNSFNKDPDGDGESWTAQLYGEKINLYADSIRKYLPKVKLIPNWKRSIITGNGSLKTLINVAGVNIDYIDVHWYWKWGEASWAEWIAKSPMELENQWYDGGTVMEEISAFNSLTTSLGHPHIKLASMEWNIGPGPWKEDPDHNKFKTALMQSEMQMQMMLGGLEIGSLWAAHWPGTDDASDRFLLDPDEGYTPNPIAKVYEMYKHALNGIVLTSNTTDNRILATTVIKDKRAFVYLLNKNNTSTNVNISWDDFALLSVQQALCFKDPGIVEDIPVVDNNSSYSSVIPGYSLTMIEFETDIFDHIFTDDMDDQNPIVIWPNPASEKIMIETVMYKNITSIQIYDVLGKPVDSMEIEFLEKDFISMQVRHLPAGIYIIVLTDESGNQYNNKLMVER